MRSAIAIVILAAVAWFAVANAAPVTVHAFLWTIDASLALVVGVTFFAGYLLGVLLLAPGFWRNRLAANANKRAHDTIKKERDALAEKSEVLADQMHQLAPDEPQAPRPFESNPPRL